MPLLPADDIPELLARLVDKSLVQVDTNGRYSLLKLVRSFVGEELILTEDEQRAKARHRDFYDEFCKNATVQMFGPDQIRIFATMSEELENLRRAIDFATTDAQTWATSVRMIDDLFLYMQVHGIYTDGIVMGKNAIARAPENSEFGRAMLWASIARLQHFQRSPETEHSIEQAIALGDQSGNIAALALAIFQKALFKFVNGAHQEGYELASQALVMARASGDRYMEGRIQVNLGNVALAQENLVDARLYYEECQRVWGTLGNIRGMAVVYANLAQIHERLGDYKSAHREGVNAMRTFLTLGDEMNLVSTLAGLCGGFWLAKDYETAAMLLGRIDAVWANLDAHPDPPDVLTAERWRARLREAMGADTFSAALEKGKDTPTMELVDKVLSNPEPWVPA